MSVERLAEVLRAQTGLTPTQKLILIGIANHDGDGGAWPSVATLATYAEASERTVQRAIREMEKLGVVTVHERAGGSKNLRGDRRPNMYVITLNGVTSGDLEAPRGDIQGLHGVTSGASRGDTAMSPEPSYEPSYEHSDSASPQSAPGKRARKPDPIWDALVPLFGAPATPTERKNRGKTVKELREAGATPDDITARAHEYRRRWPKMAFTETALRKHWTALAAKVDPSGRARGAGGVEVENAT